MDKKIIKGFCAGVVCGVVAGTTIALTGGYFYSSAVFRKAFNELRDDSSTSTDHLDNASQALNGAEDLAATVDPEDDNSVF